MNNSENRQERQSGFDPVSSGHVKGEFIRAAESFPELSYVYMEWDAHGSAPKVPADYMFDPDIPSRNVVVPTPYGRGDDRMALSWLIKPKHQHWQIEEASQRLRYIVSAFSDCSTEAEWLFSLRDTLKLKKCRLFAVQDAGKANHFTVGRRACRQAEPGEGFFMVVEDLFQQCAIACGDRAFVATALNRVTADVEKPDRNENRQRQPGENAASHLNVNIENSNVTMGNVHQTQNLATGTRSSIGKKTRTRQEKKKGIRRTTAIVGGVVMFLAALLECLYYLGWLDPIKEVIRGFLVGR